MDEPVAARMTKSEYAYASVREKILSGEFPPGSVLNQATLARTIGISTTPLREALRRLMTERFVELDAHRDARVTQLSGEEVRDLVELRRVLDPMAAALAAERRTKDDIAEIRRSVDEQRALPNDPSLQQLAEQRRFHAAIYRASHNDLLVDALDGLWDKADRYRMHALAEGRSSAERNERDDEHRLLAEHVIAGDADTAADLMRRHIDASLSARSARSLLHGDAS
ncbi:MULTISPECIES: GntR family transcriptional regulator [unclassified Saccharopolyspora]|uniref:GntR family transcriptional regulator n=1 Tax=unclassified Saccharopolyspora TaxID=2646250 RepID=UPI001CD62F72|nr:MULTISPECIES: GntR family transcriptional regulator [unclassified Saccharopolyspora]MCA1194964.1 GntR family transcriptional regulator [Saccharopolyspora sp. 6V]MCA1227613.1 GntR family transcriptional regulator [Saccharopolyspora sp. 6M]